MGLFWKSLPSFGMKLKRGINKIIFVCQQKDMSIEWMSEDSIFVVKVEQYLLRSERKRLQKMFILFIILEHKFLGRRRKEKINSFNQACSDECSSPWCTILTSPYGIMLGFYHLNLPCQYLESIQECNRQLEVANF